MARCTSSPTRTGASALAALTIAEYSRDRKHQNMLLMDTVYRFVQAGAERLSLLGCLPSRVGNQPPSATEVALLQQRIAPVARATVTAIKAVCVPVDLTASRTTWNHR